MKTPPADFDELPDTGERTTYDGGAMREADPDKPALEGVSPYAMMRLGALLTKGGKKYGDFRNWEKGMPYSRCIGAVLRHTFQYMMRDTEEDHLAAIVWNGMALMHYEETRSEFDDRPRWDRA